jgi:hypothetical protein
MAKEELKRKCTAVIESIHLYNFTASTNFNFSGPKKNQQT